MCDQAACQRHGRRMERLSLLLFKYIFQIKSNKNSLCDQAACQRHGRRMERLSKTNLVSLATIATRFYLYFLFCLFPPFFALFFPPFLSQIIGMLETIATSSWESVGQVSVNPGIREQSFIEMSED